MRVRFRSAASNLRSAATTVRSRDDVHLLAGLTAVTAWGIGPLFMRGTSVTSPTVSWYRLLVGVPVMFVAAWWSGHRPTWTMMRQTALPSFVFAVSMVAGFTALKETSVANATLIATLQPAVVMLVAPRLFGERLHARHVALAGLSMAGVSVVVLAASSTSGASIRGDVLAAINVLIWTTYFLMAKRVRLAGTNTWAFLSCVFTWSLVFVTPWSLVVADDLWSMQPHDWVLVSAMALGPGMLGHGLMTWSQESLDVTLASLLGLLTPVVATAGAWLVFGQSLGAVQMLGAVVVLGSLALLVRDQRQEVSPRLSPPEDPLLS